MQLILTASDLSAMPATLRRQLLDYMATRRKAPSVRRGAGRQVAEARAFEGLAALDRDQAVTLLRSVSFGRDAKSLHELLEALAYGRDADAPTPAHLANRLKLEDRQHLRRRFTALKRLIRSVTREAAPLSRYSRSQQAYIVHPKTRRSLREVFAEFVRPEVGEEPPWA